LTERASLGSHEVPNSPADPYSLPPGPSWGDPFSDSRTACQEAQEEVPRIVRLGFLASMFDCLLICRWLPLRQSTCLPGGPRRGPQNRLFGPPGKQVSLSTDFSPVALSTAKLLARRPKKRSQESSVLAPRAPPNPQRHPKTPWGAPKNSQAAPGSPQGAPLEPPRTTQEPPGTARELPRSPHGPQGPQEGPSFFPPFLLLPPSSLFLPPSLLPPPSFLPSLCKLSPFTFGKPICAPILGLPTGGRRHRA
jgi:hypothetical protein